MQCFPLLFKEGEMLLLDFIFVPIKEHLSLFYFKKFLYILMWFVKDRLTSRKKHILLMLLQILFFIIYLSHVSEAAATTLRASACQRYLILI